jgi:AcrR family transcriptional regulator
LAAIDVRSSRPSQDRRTQRTRAALLDAFRDLILKHGYDAVTPTTLAAAANLGRSTFYEHFANVDEVLAFSLGRLLEPLARSATAPTADPAAAGIVQHFWDNRKMAKAMLSGGGHRVVGAIFAEQLETGLASLGAELGMHTPATPPKLAAAYLAAGSLALLGEWLGGRASGSAADIAEALHSASYAAALAMSKDVRAATL